MSDELQFNDEAENNGKKDGEGQRREEVRGERRDREEERGSDREERGSRGKDKSSGRGFNMASLGRALNRPQFAGVSDAVLAQLIDTFKAAKTFENPNVPADIQQSRFQVLPYTGRKGSRALPSLLVCLPLPKLIPGGVTLVYTLCIEQPGQQVTRNSVSRGDNFEALVLAEDRMNDTYITGIREEAAGLGCKKVVLVNSQVIMAELIADVADKDNTRIIAQIFDNAIDALCGYRQEILDSLNPGEVSQYALSPDMIDKGDRLEATIEYNQPFGHDTSGLPIRTDALVTAHYSERTDDDDDDLYERTPMVEARCSLDMFIQDDESERERNRLGRRSRRRDRDEDRDEQPMQAVININSISPVDGYPNSLQLVGLGLGAVALLSNDYRYTNMVRPRKSIGGKLKPVFNLADLALLADMDDDVRRDAMDMVSNNMSDDDFAEFVDAMIRPDVAFGMVTPSSGQNASVLSIFEKIATGDNKATVDALCKKLFDAWDILTDGNFRAEYRDLNGGSLPKPVETSGSRVLIGTWADPDTATLRPLSEWNVPAVLSRAGAKDLEVVRDFQYTFEDNRHTVDYNLSERYFILKKFAPEVRVVQTAEQLVFHKTLLPALARALDEAGMSPYIGSGDTLSGRRSVGNRLFSSSATSEAGVSRRRGGRGSDRDDRGGRRSFFNDDWSRN